MKREACAFARAKIGKKTFDFCLDARIPRRVSSKLPLGLRRQEWIVRQGVGCSASFTRAATSAITAAPGGVGTAVGTVWLVGCVLVGGPINGSNANGGPISTMVKIQTAAKYDPN
jgi:hypothetical protein